MRDPFRGILLLATCCAAADLQSLYDKRQLFDVRDSVASGQAAPFFRAVVACAFNDQVSCLAESKAIIDSKPSPDLAIKVYDLLFDLHFAHGRWAEDLAAVEAEMALPGESEDPGNSRGLCRALLRHGPVTVERSAYSSIHVLYKNAHVPFSVNRRLYYA